MIFGVLAEVAEGGGLFYFFGKFVNQLVFERVDLFLQFSFDLIGHDLINKDYGRALDIITPPSSSRRPSSGAQFLTSAVVVGKFL